MLPKLCVILQLGVKYGYKKPLPAVWDRGNGGLGL